MRIKLFSICEGAFNNAGRLTIVNTYDMIGSKAFPLKMPIGVAMTIIFDATDEGKRHLELKITNTTTQLPIAKMDSEFVVPKDEKGGYLNFVSNVQGFVFPTPGEYTFSLSVDEVELGSVILPVKKDE